MGTTRRDGHDYTPLIAIAVLVAIAAMLASLAWAIPTLAARGHSGQLPPLTLRPARARRRRSRTRWPGLVVILIAGASGIGRAADVAMSRPVADRRWYQLRGHERSQ